MAVTAASGSGTPSPVFRALRHRDYRLFFIGQASRSSDLDAAGDGWLCTGSPAPPSPSARSPSPASSPRSCSPRSPAWSRTATGATGSSSHPVAGAPQTSTVAAGPHGDGPGLAPHRPVRRAGHRQRVRHPGAAVAGRGVRADDLANAIALNSSMFNMARLIGRRSRRADRRGGRRPVFAINAASYIAVLTRCLG